MVRFRPLLFHRMVPLWVLLLMAGSQAAVGASHTLPALADNRYGPVSGCTIFDEESYGSHGVQPALLPDSTAEKRHIQLLPNRLSIMESFLWGEHGVMRSTGIAPLTPETRKKELSARRFMLSAHQIGGFITMGLFIPTLIYGQRNIDMWNAASAGTGVYDRDLDHLHRNLAEVTWAAYMTTASLSIFSPPPLIRRDEGSTTTIHKTLAWVHFAGMIALPILGSLGSTTRNLSSAQGYRTAHQIVAYATAAAFTTSLIVMTF